MAGLPLLERGIGVRGLLMPPIFLWPAFLTRFCREAAGGHPGDPLHLQESQGPFSIEVPSFMGQLIKTAQTI